MNSLPRNLGPRLSLALLASVCLAAGAVPETEVGLASFYADKYHGRTTASGEVFDTRELTAAHRTLPFGTRVKITLVDHDRTVVVRINDRGPFVPGRVIDVSRAAAEELEMTRAGVVKVGLEILPPSEP